MKKLILTLMLLTGVLLTAQERHRMHHHKHGDLTAEQMATLQTKRLALTLDLTDNQQKKVQQLKLKQEELRQAKRMERKENREANSERKISTEERYEHEIARLDNMIALKAEMKSILNQSQYEKWERMQLHKKKQSRSRRHGHRRMGR